MYYFRIGSRRLINSALNYLLPSVTELKVSPILQPKYSLNRIIFYFSKNKKIVEKILLRNIYTDTIFISSFTYLNFFEKRKLYIPL